MGQIDRDATQDEALGTLVKLIQQKFHRELRYHPNFTGTMNFQIMLTKGVPVAILIDGQSFKLDPVKI
jgi:hypothetical protein